jgi:predicted RNA-binding Zn-ribbon protein involved in translation (DUF1610 family)
MYLAIPIGIDPRVWYKSFVCEKVKIGRRASRAVYAGSYEMPHCNACGREVHPGEMSESFSCPKCKSARIWRCEGCKGKSKEYKCPACGYKGK